MKKGTNPIFNVIQLIRYNQFVLRLELSSLLDPTLSRTHARYEHIVRF